ncbi:hypothetical protein [Streptomyces orinoci]|uniref:Uncharacterized protein n=1 Tax=Streptomyces orinoci TaxID=67339 RepID=A0ABV3JX77_STRON|nr:hypothetical protein [Streptomyces orinoci]
MSAKPRPAALALLAAVVAALLPVTGAAAAETADGNGPYRRPYAHPAPPSHPAPAGRGALPAVHSAHQDKAHRHHSRPAHRPGARPAPRIKRHRAASNPVQRIVQAGQTIKGRPDHGKGGLALAGALVGLGAGAFGVSRLVRRRAAGRPRG